MYDIKFLLFYLEKIINNMENYWTTNTTIGDIEVKYTIATGE